MTDVLTRVQQLIALAGSPEREEARTAAHKACELIREHKLVLICVTTSLRAPTAPPRPKCRLCDASLQSYEKDLCHRCARTHKPQWTIKCSVCGASVTGIDAEGVMLRAAISGFHQGPDGETRCSRH